MITEALGSRSWFFRCGVALAFAAALPACGLKAADALDPPELDDGDLDALSAEVESVIDDLFPDLSESERTKLSRRLSLRDALSLRAELEEVRKSVARFSADLFKSSEERVAERAEALEPHNDGFPSGLAALGRACTYESSSGHAEIKLSGVFDGREKVVLEPSAIRVSIDGANQPFSLQCIGSGSSVDIVFLIDITGSMANVIKSVRNSVVSFLDVLEASGVRGTVSVVTFQDSVGVDRTFQEPAPPDGIERSPFFAPVALDDSRRVDELRSFVTRLEANRGADAPENLAAALDFARNNVIGYSKNGAANVIGEGGDDPPATAAFPPLDSEHQVFVALTDVTFHGDDRNADNSSLLAPFVPRDAADILRSLRARGSVVHVSDPSWVDAEIKPSESSVDADYWALGTGGLGEDLVEGYSLVDLELVVVAEDSGLLDITLDSIVGSSCTLEFETELTSDARVELTLQLADRQTQYVLPVQRL